MKAKPVELTSWRDFVEDLEQLGFGKNSALEWLSALGTFIGVWLLLAFAHALLARGLRAVEAKRPSQAVRVLRDVMGATHWYFFATIALLVARHYVQVRGAVEDTLRAFTIIAVFTQIGLWIQRVVQAGVTMWAARQDSARRVTLAGGIQFVTRLVVWLFVVMLVLTYLGVEISAVVAGLGVGGVAAALAVQGLLADIFAGLAMYFDRPFDIGHFVVVDGLEGRVTRIGLRTTRVRAIDGEEIVLPNADLAKSRILNLARLKERRIVIVFGIEYGVSTETLELARKVTEEVIRAEPRARLQRVNFKDFGAESLEFEAAYFVLSPEARVWMDVRHHINIELYRRFEENGVPFASPARTFYLRHERPRGAGSPAAPPDVH